MNHLQIVLPQKKIQAFCHRWKVTEFSLFGSVLCEDFHINSDIDVLISFDDNASWSLFDLVTMQEELKQIFGREIDLVEKEGLKNPFRRKAILNSKQVIYETSGA